ncbi:hypothetical protein WICMUC_001759 [Wickerhamomyces mucosus]|uniref:Uncharacterized protein n=1 Tax=Wickerhamomyces mucosus TaxID=1378264 RepID=A0A9P8TF13_9ASCO|nr:hypothetical protein WICMUC_001759 [Wickerhamomyces mucosus]
MPIKENNPAEDVTDSKTIIIPESPKVNRVFSKLKLPPNEIDAYKNMTKYEMTIILASVFVDLFNSDSKEGSVLKLILVPSGGVKFFKYSSNKISHLIASSLSSL